MAFNLQGMNRVSSGANSNAPTLWAYGTSTDTGAQVGASAYFNDFSTSFAIGHLLFVSASDGVGFYEVTAVTPNVTTSALATIGVGGIGSAQMQAGAIDTTALGDGAVTSGKISADVIQYKLTSVNAAGFNGAYATPVVLVAAPGAGNIIVVEQCMVVCDYGGAQFAAGGVTNLQYDSTINGGGTAASATIAAATINAWAADSAIVVAGACPTAAASTIVNKGIYISNQSGAFTTGTSVLDFHVWYRVIPGGL